MLRQAEAVDRPASITHTVEDILAHVMLTVLRQRDTVRHSVGVAY
jgi:hypothetical protein